MMGIVKPWFKNFIFVIFFRLCMNLIYLALPIYMTIVYDRVFFSFSKATLYTLSIGVLISFIGMALLDYLAKRMQGQVGNSMAEKIMPFVFDNMQENGVNVDKKNLYTTGLSDLECLRNAVVQGHIFHVFDLPWVVVYLFLLYLIHPLMGVVAISAVLMTACFQMLLKIFGKNRYIVSDAAFKANSDFAGNCLHHAELVSGMGMLPAVMGKYKEKNNKILIAKNQADAFQSGIGSLIRFLHVTAMAAVFGTGAFVFFLDEITSGAVFAGVIIIARLFYPFEKNLDNMKNSIEALAAYKRLKQFVNLQKTEKKLSLPAPEGKFESEAIAFALQGKTILHNISFALEPGESLGIFGPSLAGKTSLCRVLLGIWPAIAGKIRLDGAQISQWSRDELGQYIGYLPQELELFQGSVAQNIARFREIDSDKVVKAAQKAGVHNMILKLAKGYDTQVDITGKNLSASQRQLISLARALYDEPKLVVMDEPHTYLGDLGIKLLQNIMNSLKQDKTTTVIVTDRPNLLVNMDKILMIKNGQVAMYGPAKDVLTQLTKQQQAQQPPGV